MENCNLIVKERVIPVALDCQSPFSKDDSAKSLEAKAQTLELTIRLQLLNGEIEVRKEEISSIKQNIMSRMREAETPNYQYKVLATLKAPKPSLRIDIKRLGLEHPELASSRKILVQNRRRLVVRKIAKTLSSIRG